MVDLHAWLAGETGKLSRRRGSKVASGAIVFTIQKGRDWRGRNVVDEGLHEPLYDPRF